MMTTITTTRAADVVAASSATSSISTDLRRISLEFADLEREASLDAGLELSVVCEYRRLVSSVWQRLTEEFEFDLVAR